MSCFEDFYYLLVCYVVLFLVLILELVNYFRIEFFRGEKVFWIVEVDLLLFDLCCLVGYEFYVMD